MSNSKSRSIASWLLSFCVCTALMYSTAHADPVWHCSRTSVKVADAGDNFTLAALETEREVIRISLRDLYAAYQGTPVKASGMVVSACFMKGNDAETQAALKSIGAEPLVLEKLSRKSALVNHHVYIAQNPQDMLACITKHQPAIGYLPTAMHTEAVGPCF